MVGEVKGVGLIGVGVACAGGRSRGDRRDEIEVNAKCCNLESDSLPLEATSLWRGSEATQRSAVVHRGCEDADTSMGPRAPLPGSSPLMKATVNLHRSPHSMLARCHRSIAEMRLRGEKEAPGSFSDVSLRP